MYLKINQFVKTPWHRPSMGVAHSRLWYRSCFNSWNPYPFISLKPEKETVFKRALPVQGIIWSTQRGKGILAVVTLQTFYLGKHDLFTVYLGKLDFLSVIFPQVTYLGKILSSGSWICLENNRVSLDSYLKAIAREKRNSEVASYRRRSWWQNRTAHVVKEIWGARVVYVFAHPACWISVRNNS